MDENVVYGMYSGLALLMDVHRPPTPNGIGIVFIQGSAWHTPTSLDAPQLKTSASQMKVVATLLSRGYTIFAINHRAAPTFRYPAAIEDAQRAVRYIRHHAVAFGIDPTRIGAIGGSSGGHLASMLGVLDGAGNPENSSLINRESAKVQAVVAIATWSDLTVGAPSSVVASFLGTHFSQNPESPEARLYREASPISHVSSDDPPFRLIHGDADPVVPVGQSKAFAAELASHGVSVEFTAVIGGDHSTDFPSAPNAPDTGSLAAEWFDQHLAADR